MGNRSDLDAMIRSYREFSVTQPFRFYQGQQNEHISGNYLSQSRNTFDCYDSHFMEDCRFCTNCEYFKDAYDISHYGASGSNELVYEGEGVGHGVHSVLFSKLVWGNSSDVLYSYECFASKHLFGCTGLRHAEYCILNKQYTKEEYEAFVPKIIEYMRSTKEWGEFFPVAFSPFGYNEIVAFEYYPLSEEEALSRGWKWFDGASGEGKYMGPALAAPDAIADATDDICQAILTCETSGKPYKIIPQELAFCRDMGIALPKKSPDQRHKDRMALRNPRKLWNRQCSKCEKEIETTYAPDRPETILCDECYLSSIY